MGTIALSALRTLVRGECDQESGGFVSDSLLNSFINKSADELYNLLTRKFEDWALTSSSFNLVAGTEQYSVPADFFKFGRLDLTLDGKVRSLRRLQKGKYAEYRNRSQFSGGDRTDIRYWLRKDKVHILPLPGAAITGTLWYTPTRTQLSLDADTLDGVSGWEEYVVVDAAIKASSKEESSQVQDLLVRKKAIYDEIVATAKERDRGAPAAARDAYEEDDSCP